MHIAIFIVNQNGSLVYHKVSFYASRLVDHLWRAEILDKWHHPFGLHFPFDACDIVATNPQLAWDPHELRQRRVPQRHHYGWHKWDRGRYLQTRVLPKLHWSEIHSDIGPIAQGLGSGAASHIWLIRWPCEQEPFLGGRDAHQKWSLRTKHH